tara:strand:- start:969 stop:1598 length:630 start_codon:yes stop_codon:yes gene_type:complete
MKFVCSSDTHGKHNQLSVPDGDVFIFTGDVSEKGSAKLLPQFNEFLGNLPHKHKIVVSGNHDILYEIDCDRSLQNVLTNCVYLDDSEITIEGIRIWGARWNPNIFNKMAEGNGITNKWDLVPEGIDILLSHGAPFGLGDINSHGNHAGSKDLLQAIRRIKPKYYVFGHLHRGYGVYEEYWNNKKITCINAAAFTDIENKVNPPIVFEIE